jgi:hypothetical protein
MSIFRMILKLIIGIIFSLISVLALSPMLAATLGDKPAVTFILMALIVIIIALAPTVRRAFGRGFLCLGAAVFALPLSTMILSSVVTSESVSMATDADKTMAGFGGVVAGGLMTGVAGLIGFFFGSVLLLFGLILSLGGRREVIVVMSDNAPSLGRGKREPKV